VDSVEDATIRKVRRTFSINNDLGDTVAERLLCCCTSVGQFVS